MDVPFAISYEAAQREREDTEQQMIAELERKAYQSAGVSTGKGDSDDKDGQTVKCGWKKSRC